MKKTTLTALTILFGLFSYAQDKVIKDSTTQDQSNLNKTSVVVDSSSKEAFQEPVEDGVKEKDFNKGVTVTPSHIDFSADMGETQVRKIKVTNHTSTQRKFSVNYFDFDISEQGKSEFLPNGTSRNSLSKFLSISPNLVEIKPGQFKEVTITLSIPNSDSANRAFWGAIMLEEAKERKSIEPAKQGKETIAFGIVPTFAFGIWLFQNPPNVKVSEVEITNLELTRSEEKKNLNLEVKNIGDGISFCYAYVELTNLSNGKQTVLGGKKYTILPGYNRNFNFELSKDLPKGNYSAVGVVDYYNSDELIAAELEFEIK